MRVVLNKTETLTDYKPKALVEVGGKPLLGM